VVLASSDLVNPNLTILTDTLPSNQRYSFNFSGNAQALDHILVDNKMLPRVSRFAYARNNADFPESFSTDGSRSERISDHDMPVAYFTFPPPVADLTISVTDSPDPVLAGTNLTYTLTVTNNGPDTASNVVVTDILPFGVNATACEVTTGGACRSIGNVILVLFNSLKPSTTQTVKLTTSVERSLPNNSILRSIVTVGSNISDPTPLNNVVITSTTVTKSRGNNK